MMDYIWGFMILSSLVFGWFTGRIEPVTTSSLTGAGNAVQTAIGLLGSMALWCGLIKIAESSGLVKVVARLLHPLTKFLFPKLPQDSKAMNAIVMNMAANILGLGNAATPLGIIAIKELAKDREYRKGIATNDMAMLVLINTASLQLIPSTVIAMRTRNLGGGTGAFDIIVPVWICSIMALVIAVSIAKWKIMRAKKCKY